MKNNEDKLPKDIIKAFWIIKISGALKKKIVKR